MFDLSRRIDRKLSLLRETNEDVSYKDNRSESYDRQVAEDALYHTIGPLTETPRWSSEWTSQSTPVPGFSPNGPAPKWTPEQVIYAYAGDPDLLDGDTKNDPKSPKYGRSGGSPLYRLAARQMRRFNKVGDYQALSNAFSNGLLGLMNMMRPGYDEGRSPFISFVARNIEGAIVSGVGATRESIRAAGGASKSGIRGLMSVLDSDNPDEIRSIADQVKGKYQTARSTDKNVDNPFGVYSSRFYKTVNDYADALESKDEDRIESTKGAIEDLQRTIEDESVSVRGIGTGSEQAISTPDRATSIGLVSFDNKDDDSAKKKSLEAAAPTQEVDAGIEPEAITFILQTVLDHDLGAIVGNIPRYQQIAADAGAEIVNGVAKIGGKMTANEFRYVLRQLGPLGLNYPGAGVPRSNTAKPRDAANWWKPGEDPEIEPISDEVRSNNPNLGETWVSIWKRNNGPQMGPTEVAAEMTQEVKELQALGIPTARSIKSKTTKTGAVKEEAVSKVAVFAAMKSAFVKLKIAAYLYKIEHEDDDLNESMKAVKSIPLMESIDLVDKQIISEAFDFIIMKVRDFLVREFI